jgi:hypothetical protein
MDGGFHDLEMVGDAFAHVLDFQKPYAGRGDYLCKGSETHQQRYGQWLGVTPGQGGKQRQLKLVLIGHGIRAAIGKAYPQALAMAVCAIVCGIGAHGREQRRGIIRLGVLRYHANVRRQGAKDPRPRNSRSNVRRFVPAFGGECEDFNAGLGHAHGMFELRRQ